MNLLSLFGPLPALLAAAQPAQPVHPGMPAWLTFGYGIALLVLLFWYFAADDPTRKRTLGTVLTVVMVAFCLESVVQEGIHKGIDLQGGTSFLIRLDTPPAGTVDKDSLDQAVEVIRKRVDAMGNGEPVISPEGTDRILVQIADLDPASVKDAEDKLKQVARLEFRLVRPDSQQLLEKIDKGEEPVPPGCEIRYEYQTDADSKPVLDKNGKKVIASRYIVKKEADMGGEHVVSAHAFFTTQYGVSLTLDNVGKDLFGKLTGAAYDQHTPLAILLDGDVVSAPGVDHGAIYDGSAEITGNFNEASAHSLASVLQNPLRTPVHIEDERQASATLGADSIKSGIYSGLAGLLLVAVFMIVYYRVVGVIAIGALVINCVMVVGFLAMFKSVLTLPGIAGLILSLGIAIDANVLIYERLREELDHEKPLKAAIESSYSKAFSAIFDAHVTQFLTAAILFWLANGPVRGFALTLTIGIVASMFSSLLITYTCFSWAFAINALNHISMLHLIRSKGFDFVGNARKFIALSLLLVAISIGTLVYRGQANLGSDFRGGDRIVLSSKQPLTPDQVRGILGGAGLGSATIQSERTADHNFISIRSDYGSAEKIEDHLKQSLPDAGLTFESVDHTGALVGNELARKSGIALLMGLAGIFLYMCVRFETSFAVGSIVALAHDLIITLGIFALTGRELSLIMVGAVLSIAGYSINDKVVVFDRIRSGLRDRHGGNTVAQIVNTSINETLSRTILTGGTALLTVLALYFFGGPVLNDFAFSFVIGIVVGTYSSIFIASPIVLWWSRRGGASLHAEIKRKPEPPIGGRLASS